jgi:DNA-binding IclR family transcriptional regulator
VILDVLRTGDRQPEDIAATAGVPARTVSNVLTRLASHGIVRYGTMRTGRRGLPPRIWSLARATELAAFDAAADQLTQRLLDLQAEEHRQAVAASTKRTLRLVSPADADSELA